MDKTLIVYYTYTGNTKIIASQIKQQLNCDMLELQPVVPFSSDYQTVVDEWQNNSIKAEVKIKDLNINLQDYDNIILCSPIWWYTITPVVMTFLKQNDLSNKTIYPVLTSAGWFGHAVEDIKKLAPQSKIGQSLLVNTGMDYSAHIVQSYKPNFNEWLNSIK